MATLTKQTYDLTPPGQVVYYPQWLGGQPEAGFTAEELYNLLVQTIPWQKKPVQMFGKMRMQPRLVALYSLDNHPYKYARQILQAEKETPYYIHHLMSWISQTIGQSFPTVLLNYYQDGQDNIGFHSDDEPLLGVNPIIPTLSLGATRRFILVDKSNKDNKIEFHPNSGDLLIMQGFTQQNWKHGINKESKVKTGRISLTFRNFIDQNIRLI